MIFQRYKIIGLNSCDTPYGSNGCMYTSMFLICDFPSIIEAKDMNAFLVVIHGGMFWLTMHIGHNESFVFWLKNGLIPSITSPNPKWWGCY